MIPAPVTAAHSSAAAAAGTALALPLPAEQTLAADAMEDTRQITIATGLKEARWVRAVDLLPGNPAIVRSAIVALLTGTADDLPWGTIDLANYPALHGLDVHQRTVRAADGRPVVQASTGWRWADVGSGEAADPPSGLAAALRPVLAA